MVQFIGRVLSYPYEAHRHVSVHHDNGPVASAFEMSFVPKRMPHALDVSPLKSLSIRKGILSCSLSREMDMTLLI